MVKKKRLTHHKKVIELVVPGSWTFFDFRYANGNNPIADWYSGLPEEGQYGFTDTLKDIQKIENHQNWLCFKRFLRGEFKKYRIWELWFPGDKRQYRIIGIFGPGRKQVTLLAGCYHKGSVYTPPDALKSALTRAKLLSEGKAGRDERKIPTSR